MKKRRKIFIPIIAVVFVALSVLIITVLDLTPEKPNYTIFNYRQTGTSLLFDTLNEMGYSVLPEYEMINENSEIYTPRIVIMPNPNYYLGTDVLAEYVYNGGRVIYLPNRPDVMTYHISTKGANVIYEKDEFILFEYGLGEILVGPQMVTNEILLTNKTAGYYIADTLDYWQARNVLINEAVHGYLSEPDFWSAIPVYIKNAIYQFLIMAALIVLYLGKRFGRAVPYYEEIERGENEYLIALANVYNMAGDGYIAYETGLKAFLKKACDSFGLIFEREGVNITNSIATEQIRAVWQKRSLPYYDELKELLGYNESDFKTKTITGRKRLVRARDILKRLENAL